jgi:hypothetical protein
MMRVKPLCLHLLSETVARDISRPFDRFVHIGPKAGHQNPPQDLCGQPSSRIDYVAWAHFGWHKYTTPSFEHVL